MGLEELYDFLDDNMDSYVDDFFNEIPSKMYTVGEFKKIVDDYPICHIVEGYQCYLKNIGVRDTSVEYDELLVIGSRFYHISMNRFFGKDMM